MLILSRKLNEALTIGDGIRITVTEIDSNRVRLGIDAPKDVLVLREELRTSPPRDDVPRCGNCKCPCDAGQLLCIDCTELAADIHF